MPLKHGSIEYPALPPELAWMAKTNDDSSLCFILPPLVRLPPLSRPHGKARKPTESDRIRIRTNCTCGTRFTAIVRSHESGPGHGEGGLCIRKSSETDREAQPRHGLSGEERSRAKSNPSRLLWQPRTGTGYFQ